MKSHGYWAARKLTAFKRAYNPCVDLFLESVFGKHQRCCMAASAKLPPSDRWLPWVIEKLHFLGKHPGLLRQLNYSSQNYFPKQFHPKFTVG